MRSFKVVLALFLSIAAFPCLCIGTIHAKHFTVVDYLDQSPEKFSIDDEGRLNLSNLGLHSLEGLERVPNADQVITLDLQGNNIKIVPDEIFNTFTHLQHLWLKGNQIAIVEESAFSGLNELTWLSLSNNQLFSLPENVFKGMKQLHYLALRGNYFTAFPQNIFKNLPGLQEVYLEKNQLMKKDFRKTYGLSRKVVLQFGNQYTAEGMINRIQSSLESPA